MTDRTVDNPVLVWVNCGFAVFIPYPGRQFQWADIPEERKVYPFVRRPGQRLGWLG